MTTVVTDGDYIAADHRTTSTHNSYRSTYDIRDGLVIAESVSDSSLKLKLVDQNLNLLVGGRERIVAYACAGDTKAINGFQKLLAHLTGTKQLYSIMNTLETLVSEDKGFTIVYVTEGGRTGKRSFPKDKFSVSKNKLITGGSGASYINFFRGQIPDLTVPEAMCLAAAFDKHTSPSYSVYGVRENILYTNVSLSKEDNDKLLLNTLSRVCYKLTDFKAYIPGILKSYDNKGN